MLQLEQSLRAWDTPEFAQVLKREIAQFAGHLPLQQGLMHGNHVMDAPLTVLLNHAALQGAHIEVRATILYQGLIAGCSCMDDPSSGGETNESCDVLLEISLQDAHTRVWLCNED